jgi:hypothetical protein
MLQAISVSGPRGMLRGGREERPSELARPLAIVPTEPEIELYKDGFDGKDLLDRKDTSKRLSELVTG